MSSSSPRKGLRASPVALVLVLIVAAGCDRFGEPPPPSGPIPTAPATILPLPASSVATIVGAGDIAVCDQVGDEQTADLIDGIDGVVIAAGDNLYGGWSANRWAACYGPSWGRHVHRTRAVAGNHEYDPGNASAYVAAFGAAAAPSGTTWYAFRAGSWEVIVLDSNCDRVGGCGADSEQGRWLEATLDASTAECTLAVFHHPRFSSGSHGPSEHVEAFWRPLHAAGADVVFSAHEHSYERFAPQDPDGGADPDRGLRQFVVGTGGAPLRGFGSPVPNSEVREGETHGVLELTLRDGGYDWRFVPVAPSTFTDEGSGTCH